MSRSNLYDKLKNAKNESGNYIWATGATIPTDATAGYEIGCPFFNSTDGLMYTNVGTAASCNFDVATATVGANLDLGSSGTSGSLDVFPATASKGKLALTATNNAADHTLGITNRQMGQATALGIPDPGAAAGEFVLTNSAHQVIVNANGSDRTLALNGNVSLGGALTTVGAVTTTGGALTVATPAGGGTLTMTGDVTYTGAFNPTFAVPSSSTWTLPTGGGTLATVTGAETGTTAETFTVNSDGTAKIAIDVAGAGTGVMTLRGTPVADVVITFPAATDTLVNLASTQTLSAKTLTTPVIATGLTATGAGSVNFSGSTATFLTPSGAVTIGPGAVSITGDITGAANIVTNMSASSGAFSTSTGTNTLNGNVVIPANKTFDASASNGTFKTSSGTNTFAGDVVFTAGKDITFSGAGDGTFGMANQTGTFATSTGANSLNGDTTVANSKNLIVNSTTGTGYVQINAQTTGALKFLPVAATAQTVTLTTIAQTSGAGSIAIPDLAAGTDTFVYSDSVNAVKFDVEAPRTLTIGGALTTTSTVSITGAFATGAAVTFSGANAIQFTTTGAYTYTLPAATSTLATLGFAETFSAVKTFTAAPIITLDDTTDGVVNALTVTHSSSDNAATALDGVGVSFKLENVISTVEEWASIDALSTTLTDAAEIGDIVFNTMRVGSVLEAMRLDGSDESLTLGTNETSAVGINKLRIFPQTTASGSLVFAAVANTGDSVTTITNAAQGGAYTYTIPNAGASKYFAMSASATGATLRADMTEEALALYTITTNELRQATGVVLDATGGANLFKITTAGMGTGTLTIDGEAASGNSKTDTLMFEFSLPPEYVAAGDVKIVVRAKESVGAATTATTLSGEAYEVSTDGGVSANLLGAFDASDITTDWASFTASVTAAALLPGDRLRFYVRIVTNDTGAAVGTIAQIGQIQVQADIKG